MSAETLYFLTMIFVTIYGFFKALIALSVISNRLILSAILLHLENKERSQLKTNLNINHSKLNLNCSAEICFAMQSLCFVFVVKTFQKRFVKVFFFHKVIRTQLVTLLTTELLKCTVFVLVFIAASVVIFKLLSVFVPERHKISPNYLIF